MGGTNGLAASDDTAGPMAARGRPSRRRADWGDRYFAQTAVLPTAAVMLLIFGLPLVFSAWLSVEAWSPDQTLFGGKFAGIDNYQDLLTDPEFIGSLTLTLLYTVAAVAAELFAGLGIALLLNIDLPWIGLFRTLLIIPMMITPVVAAFCWKLLLDPDHGVINYFIGRHIVWLGRPDTALLSVGIVNVWQNAPYVAILLLAGLRSLPSEPVEAARIDGASTWQMFRHVTLPLLRPYILVALLLRMIFEFRSFDNVYVMTSGGPADATMLLSMYTYLASFVRFDMSLAAAASWMMLVISIVLCGLFIALIRRRRDVA
jgi:multiple sugar transport system permease protein